MNKKWLKTVAIYKIIVESASDIQNKRWKYLEQSPIVISINKINKIIKKYVNIFPRNNIH